MNAKYEATIILLASDDVENEITVIFHAANTDAELDYQDAPQTMWPMDSNETPVCDYVEPGESGETSCEIFIEAEMQKVVVPDCAPSTRPGIHCLSVCGSTIKKYHRIDRPQRSKWVQSSHRVDPSFN